MINDIFARLLPTNRSGIRAYLTGGIVCQYASGVFLVLQFWVLTHILTGAVFDQESVKALTPSLVILAGLFTGRFITAFSGRYLTALAATYSKRTLRKTLYQGVKHSGPVVIARKGSGSIINSLTDGVEAIGAYYQDYLPSLVLMVALPITILVIIMPLDWLSALILIVTAPVIPLLMVIIGKRAEHLSRTQWRELNRMSNYLLDMIQGLVTLKLFNRSQTGAARIAEVAEQFRYNTMAVLRIAFLSSMALEFFAMVSTALVAILIGMRVYDGSMGFQDGFFILLLAPEFYAPLRKMGAAKHIKMEAMAAAEQVHEWIIEDESKTPNQPDTKAINEPATLKFTDVQFAYTTQKEVLNDFSLDIMAGHHIAVVGESGAGKSTIFNLLLGFVAPQQGRIEINGQSLSDIDMKAWRQCVSWIPQSPTLMAGTVMDNIKMGCASASDSQVYKLCQSLGIHDFISHLPNKYQTVIGEQGQGLSGGEIQRLAIARALLRDAPLILLDEPTASLDKQTEAVLLKAMTTAISGKTVITIAHRLHTVRRADLIVVMQNGQIAATGTHAELLKRNSIYKRLVAEDFTDSQSEVAA